MTRDRVEAFTDGACRGNPGPGGWAALLRYNGHEKLLSGGDPHTTNNRMELLGAIHALEALKRPCHVRLHTDSEYVQRGITEWLAGWKRKGWKTSAGQPVKNVDLWERLDRARSAHAVDWQWVRGHAGHPENERVDAAAREAAARQRST